MVFLFNVVSSAVNNLIQELDSSLGFYVGFFDVLLMQTMYVVSDRFDGFRIQVRKRIMCIHVEYVADGDKFFSGGLGGPLLDTSNAVAISGGEQRREVFL